MSYLGVLVLCLALAACGKKGDPLPPFREVPLQTTDLVLRQQGRLILFEMTYPSVTSSGLALGGIEAVELYEMIKPALAGAVPPVQAPEFAGRAEVLLTLRGAELGTAITGDRIQFRIPLAEELPEEPAAHYFGVRTVKGEESSELSNLATVVPIEPPPAPASLKVSALPDSIELTWEAPAEGVEGFAVYRREAQERGYGEPIQQLGAAERRYRDIGVEYGRRYIYTVRTLARLTPPILSAEAGEREVDYVDRFPPPLPRNFVALGERSRVRLRWEASDADDVAGYVLYRKEPGRDFHRITEDLVTRVEYIDRGLVGGFQYSYRIQVVDDEGNESEQSEPVETTVR